MTYQRLAIKVLNKYNDLQCFLSRTLSIASRSHYERVVRRDASAKNYS